MKEDEGVRIFDSSSERGEASGEVLRSDGLTQGKGNRLVLGMGTKARIAIGQIDTHLGCTLLDLFAAQRRNSAGNFSSVRLVVHQQHLQVLQVVNAELVLAIGEHETRTRITAVANLRGKRCTLVLPAHTVINTMGPAPAGL